MSSWERKLSVLEEKKKVNLEFRRQAALQQAEAAMSLLTSSTRSNDFVSSFGLSISDCLAHNKDLKEDSVRKEWMVLEQSFAAARGSLGKKYFQLAKEVEALRAGNASDSASAGSSGEGTCILQKPVQVNGTDPTLLTGIFEQMLANSVGA